MAENLIDIKFDPRQISAIQRAMAGIRNGFARVAQGAISKTLTRVKSLAVRQLARDARIKQKSLRRDVFVKRPSFKVLAGFVRFKGGRVPIAEMYASQTAKGVTFRGREARQLIPGAFTATMPSGHSGIWKRTGSKAKWRQSRSGRETITELFGPSFWFLWETHPETQAEVRRQAGGLLQTEIERRMDYLLVKHGAR
jgi:hypothetical protein